MVVKKVTLQYFENYQDETFWIIRLAGSGAGTVEEGDKCKLTVRSKVVSANAEVIAVIDKRLRELTQADAEHLPVTKDRKLSSLKESLTEMYRFRPYWAGDETHFRLIQLRKNPDT